MTRVFRVNETDRLDNGVTALGTFDGVHIGHAEVLRRAAAYAADAGLTARALTFPELPGDFIEERAFAPRIMSNALRERAIAACGIGEICYFDLKGGGRTLSAAEFVSQVLVGKLSSRHVVCGFNFRFGRGCEGDTQLLARLLNEHGVTLEVIPPVSIDGEAVSSSRIRRLIADGDMRAAAKALGRPFATDFTVEHGKQIGRSIGFPTINQFFPAGYVIPSFGVYATQTVVDGELHGSVTNIGTRPTVGGQSVTEETYIFGTDRMLYGKETEVRYLGRIRSERYFDGLDELREQIKRDTAEAKVILNTYGKGEI